MKTDQLLPWPAGQAPDPAQCGEETRASVLAAYGLDSLENDPELVQITEFAAQLCGAPICLVSLVEKERQRFLAREGLKETETPRPTSFCAHAMLEPDPLVITDARTDERFETNPLVTGHPHIRFYAGAPLISHEGAPLGSLCVIDTKPRPDGLTQIQSNGLQVLAASVMRRLRHRREALAQQAELKQNELRLRTLADSIPDIAWSAGPDGSFDYFNKRWFDFITPEDGGSAPMTDLFHPDDRTAWHDAWEEAREKEEPYETEYRLLRGDGEYRWVLVRGSPVRGTDGSIDRWFGTITDIDDNHRESEKRDLLARELSHRIKNIFAVISGLIVLRTRGRDELTDFAEEISETIRALGRAHDFVRPIDSAKGDSLHGLLRELMAPYVEANRDRIEIDGDDLKISERAATPLALVFHELATNSAKYGAFSSLGGKVLVCIERHTSDKADDLVIEWSETGGPKVVHTDRQGFGSRLIRMAVQSQLRGSLTRDMLEKGMKATLTIPAEAIS